SRRSRQLSEEQALEFRRILEELLARKRTRAWEWFAPLEARLDDLAREVATVLGFAALRRGDADESLALANRIIESDPCDEPARELRIRALLALGDHSFARRELRDYQRVLAAELGAEPSPEILALVARTKPNGSLAK